jgi:hypothetical protein
MEWSKGIWGLILAFLVVFWGGCATDSSVRVRSEQSAVMDAPRLPLAVYASPDSTTADIYLTDLTEEDLDPAADLAGLSGRIVSLHLFVVPLAGTTPLDPTACSVTVRHIVLAKGNIGVYSGGGFLNPSRAGGQDLAGHIEGATLRLTGKTPGFVDKLGPATLDATFKAAREEGLARRIKVRVEEILAKTGAPPPSNENSPKDRSAKPQ